ncbi:MAG: hypothetical protein PVJ34_01310 [Anaerolineae bacterium]|jgi:myo-inositol catabolism protein IolC
MVKMTTTGRMFDWPVDSPLAIESYAVAMELEDAFRETIANLLAQIQKRLNVPEDEEPPAVEQIREMFRRYQQTRPSEQKLLSEMIVDMREERLAI